MYVDSVVLAGIGTVILMLAFFGGVVFFLMRDANKKKHRHRNS